MSRNLLICFDAFGTLFAPKLPIAQQYGEVARSLGLTGFTDEQVQDSFKKAFKHEAQANPNFGKGNGMNPEKWWSNIIHNTFQPLVDAKQQIHKELAPRLLSRFATEDAYILTPGALPLLHALRRPGQRNGGRTVVGVITNSDDRVPGILRSLGLSVSPLRYGSQPGLMPTTTERYDIEFTTMSYDVGHEKPDRRIFAAAEELLTSLPAAANATLSDWDKVYVGDEYAKDVVGATNADWHAVLVNDEAPGQHADVEDLNHAAPADLVQHLKASGQAVAIRSLERLMQWL